MSGDTLVNADTGEVIAEMTPDEARELTDKIGTAIGVTWELIVRAYKGRAWSALGHPSWDAYTAAEFGKYRLRLPSEERQETVASLRESGLSTRAIAAAVGVSDMTVRRDIEAGATNVAPEDRPSVDPAPSSAVSPDGEPGDEADAPAASSPANPEGDPGMDVMARLHDEAAKDRKITGTDGKQYPAAQAKVAKIRELAAQDLDPGQIAEAMGVATSYVSNTAARHGIEITSGSTRAAVAARVAKAKQLAAEGHSSRQIAGAVGISVDSFGAFRRRHGIEVPADSVIGQTRRLDHDRIVSETVSSLEGIAMGIGLIGDAGDAGLDPDQIEGWATSLRSSLTALNRFSKQLKEMTQ